MDTKVIDPSSFQKAPRKLRGSVYDDLIVQITKLPRDKGILVPVEGEARAQCARMQTGIRALLKARGIQVMLSFAPSADGKQIMISHRKEKAGKAEKPSGKAKPKTKTSGKSKKGSK